MSNFAYIDIALLTVTLGAVACFYLYFVVGGGEK
jgi:hypothetical protein